MCADKVGTSEIKQSEISRMFARRKLDVCALFEKINRDKDEVMFSQGI